MRVLWFTNVQMQNSANGGVGVPSNVGGWMSALLEALTSNGHDNDLVLSVAFLSKNFSRLDTKSISYYSFRAKSVQDDVKRIILDFRPDVIHVHGTESVAQTLVNYDFGQIPIICSLQGVMSGLCYHYAGGLSSRELKPYNNYLRKTLIGDVFDVMESWRLKKSKLEQRFLSKVSVVLGRTEWDRAWAEVLAPQAKYQYVGELMRAPFYRGVRNVSGVKRHTIYCSAALSYPLKGGHWLMKAVAILKRKYPDVQMRVASSCGRIFTSGLKNHIKQGQYERYLRHLAKELDIVENLICLPSISAEEVRRELECAEVFCLPSLCENSPNSLGEAILTGVPAVVTDVGGVSSIIKDYDAGILIPSADPAIMAKELDYMFNHMEYMSEKAKICHSVFLKRYDKDNVVKQLLSAYRGTIE